MRVRIETVTPKMARDLLARNKNNRRVDRRRVKALKADLESGNWGESPDAIAVAKDGRLLNGQHRLLAIAESGVSAMVLIAWDCEDGIIKNTDRGRTRALKDSLAMAGVECSKAETSVFKFLISAPDSGRWVFSTTEEHELFDALLPTVRRSVELSKSVDASALTSRDKDMTVRNTSMLTAVARAGLCGFWGAAEELLRQVGSREPGSVGLALLSNLQTKDRKWSGKGGARPRAELYACSARCIKAVAEGRRLAHVYGLSTGGGGNEKEELRAAISAFRDPYPFPTKFLPERLRKG